jgi:multiple sugar transport system permease protein
VTAITPASSTVKLPPELIPSNPTLDNITNLIALSGTGGLRVLGLEDVRMSRMLLWFVNTLLLALVSTGIHVLFDTMAGYAFAKRKFPGSNLFFG